MLREAITDEFDDPPTTICPHGTFRTKFRQEAGAITYGPPRYYLDDVGEEEWERVWVGGVMGLVSGRYVATCLDELALRTLREVYKVFLSHYKTRGRCYVAITRDFDDRGSLEIFE
jgi:hypothetical protein